MSITDHFVVGWCGRDVDHSTLQVVHHHHVRTKMKIGVVDQDVESDPPSSDHLTLQAVAPGVVDQDADSFFPSTIGSVL